jgi:ribosomal protein S18 acetylase RimI-like enzyme
VRAGWRGRGVGRALAEEILIRARQAGYARMRLDTVPTMREAMGLYRALGFTEIAPYYPNPVPGATFLELALAKPA